MYNSYGIPINYIYQPWRTHRLRAKKNTEQLKSIMSNKLVSRAAYYFSSVVTISFALSVLIG